MNQFLWGALATCAWIIGVFFLRFWRLHGDRLFLYFFIAFWALSLNWMWLAMVPSVDETRHYGYLLRLLAFTLIIIGVVDKNRRSRTLLPVQPQVPQPRPSKTPTAESAWN